jgi:uracil-DNA glycosylase
MNLILVMIILWTIMLWKRNSNFIHQSMSKTDKIVQYITYNIDAFIDYSPKFLSRTIKTFTIFHPSYLMRQPSKKKVAWQDMLALESFLK